jgi:hypothetical protein
VGLAFLAPLFLLGLAALAIPIWYHLSHRERKEIVEFPSLMFLERIPLRAERRRTVRHPLLLALRLLALLLLVLAFSRPVFGRLGAEPAGGAAREVVLLLDGSGSMGFGTRWERALAEVRTIVEGLGAEDRASLLVFSSDVAVLVSSGVDRLPLHMALDTLRPAPLGTRLAPALQAAAGLLEDSELPRLEVRLVSDFQRGGWTGAEGIRLPPGAELIPHPVGGEGDVANTGIAGVTVRRERVGGEERVTLAARVVHTGATGREALPVVLELNGREVGRAEVSLPPEGAEGVILPTFTLTDRDTQVRISLGSDGLEADDAFHLVLSPGEGVGVVVIDGSRRPQGSTYISQALAIGESPSFRVQLRTPDSFRAADLEAASVAVFLDAPLPVGEAGGRLAEWVAAGGGLLVAPGEAAGYNEAGSLLPGSAPAPLDRGGRGGTLGFLDYAHPSLELFAGPGRGDLTEPRFLRVRPLRPVDGARVLARFDDGEVALAERSVGAGRVLLWGGTLDAHWTDLPLHPVFLPLVRGVAGHLAGYRPSPVARVAGEWVPWTGGGGSERDGDLVVTPPDGRGAVPVLVEDGEALLPVRQTGFYLVRGGVRVTPLAVNMDATESDLRAMDPREVVSAVSPLPGEGGGGRTSGVLTREEQEGRQSAWWYLMILSLLLLGAEAILGNRLSRSAAHG